MSKGMISAREGAGFGVQVEINRNLINDFPMRKILFLGFGLNV